MPKVVPGILSKLAIRQETLEVLDLGCGPGNLKDYTSFKRYVGVDLSSEMLREAGESGYSELIEAAMEEYAASPLAQKADGVFVMSATYFLNSTDLTKFITDIDRLAKKFWILSFDNISDKIRALYREQGIETFNHCGTAVPWEDCRRIPSSGWYSVPTDEEVGMELIVRSK